MEEWKKTKRVGNSHSREWDIVDFVVHGNIGKKGIVWKSLATITIIKTSLI